MRECPRCEKCFEDDTLVCSDDQAKTKTTLPGTTLLNSRYRLTKRLGRGAMGQVYLARDENLVTRRVAVKTIRPDVLSDEDLQEGEGIALSRVLKLPGWAISVGQKSSVGVGPELLRAAARLRGACWGGRSTCRPNRCRRG